MSDSVKASAGKASSVPWQSSIPATWDVVPLRHFLLALDQGWSPVAEDRLASGSEWAVLKLSAVGRGKFYPAEQKALRPSEQPDPCIEVTVGDVLLTRANTPALVGDACYVDQTLPHLMFSDLIYRLRFSRRLNPRYACYWLISRPGRHVIEVDARGSSRSMVKISQSHIRAWPIALPPLPVQEAIANFLDRATAKIDRLLEEKQRLIDLLEEKRTALITRAVTKGLDPDVEMKDSGVEWLGDIPADWSYSRLKFLAHFVTSGSRGWSQYYSEEGATFIRIGNLRSGAIDLDMSSRHAVNPPNGKETERARANPGDLLISITALIGAVGLVPEGLEEAYVNQHLALVRLRAKEVNPRWLAYCLLSRIGQVQFEQQLYGGTKDGLGLDDVRDVVVLLPPLNVQDALVQHLDDEVAALDRTGETIRQAITLLREYRTALVSAAVTGKIDVREEVA